MMDIIREINGTAPMMMTQYSKVPDLDWILDAKCMDGCGACEGCRIGNEYGITIHGYGEE